MSSVASAGETAAGSQTHGGRWAPILKPYRPWRVEPNLVDYDAARAVFSWETARRALDGLPGGRGLNIAHEAVDRHAAGARAEKTALRCLGKDGATSAVTYRQLRDATNRLANVLAGLGVGAGDRVFV